jgi:hypothetical protein
MGSQRKVTYRWQHNIVIQHALLSSLLAGLPLLLLPLLLLQVKSKEVDYYALLGLQHERFMATEAQLKQGEQTV